jgi:methionyl-tRNA formyltransferase
MIAAETSRSRAYLQALVRNNLLPCHVLVLQPAADQPLPGQLTGDDPTGSPSRQSALDDCWSEAWFDPAEPLEATLRRARISGQFMACDDVNDTMVVSAIEQRPESVLIYSGFGGVLLRSELLQTGKRFLHVHGGYLPDFKGSTTNYYSLLIQNSLGASSLFLNEDIDSGPVLIRRKFPPPVERSEMDHRFDSAARAKVLVETLHTYVKNGEWRFELPENSGGRTYYIIHPVLKHIAILAVSGGA